MRVPSFPAPVYGETVASVVARYLARAGIVAGRHLDMLGLKRASATTVVPVDLDALTGGVPEKHPWCDNGARVIQQHTAIPWFLYFSGQGRVQEVTARLMGSASVNPAASLGITTLTEGSLTSKFCPSCVRADVHSKGFPVAYREHQIPYVLVCSAHGCLLHHGCKRCNANSKSISAWTMAGTCGCVNPITGPVRSEPLDANALDGLLWIARQVQWALSKQAASRGDNPAQLILEGLKAKGYAGRSGVSSHEVKGALLRRFGTGFFEVIGELALVDVEQPHRWPARLLSRAAISGTRVVDSLRALLLSSLLCEHLSELPLVGTTAQGLPRRQAEPKGYGRKQNLGRDLLDVGVIEGALVLKDGRLPAAAELLGVSPAKLAVDMQHLGLRCALSASTRKRLGDQVIAEARDALRTGVSKKQTMQQLSLSEWSLQLIELDDPSLSLAHQEATVARQRDSHREAVLDYLQRHPSALRSALEKNCVSACDWLRRFDPEWLAAHWPARQMGRHLAERAAKKGWTLIDETLVALLEPIIQDELSKKERPVWLSPTALMRSAQDRAGSSTPNRARTPKLFEAAQAKAESRWTFERRKIRWALEEHARDHTPVAMKTLRRTAGMLPAMLIEHKQWVQDCAAELDLSIDARCVLSMHR